MKKIKYLPLSVLALALVACGSTSVLKPNTSKPTEDNYDNIVIDDEVASLDVVPSKQKASTLAYQTTTSLITIANQPLGGLKMKNSISQEGKTAIEALLPTIDLLVSNAEFYSEITTSDLEGYEFKQIISYTNFANEKVSYDLYYNFVENEEFNKNHDKDDDKHDDDKHDDNDRDDKEHDDKKVAKLNDVVETSEEVLVSEPVLPSETSEDVAPATSETPVTSDDATSAETPVEPATSETPVSSEVTVPETPATSETVPATPITPATPSEFEEESRFEGIVKFEEATYNFVGMNEVEVDAEEQETELELKIFTTEDKASFIKVKQEKEVEATEIEEEYKYEIVENHKKVSSFSFENSLENEVGETKIKLTLDNVKYSFKVYEEAQETYIRVKYDHKKEDEGSVTYKKVITTLEDGSEVVTFEEVVK